MVDFAESVKGALKGGLCAVLAADEAAVKLLSRLTGSPIGAYPLASGLRRQLCSDDPDNDPEYTPPFTGGQCFTEAGYSFTFTATDLQGNRASSQQGTGGRLVGTDTRFNQNGNPVAGYLRQLNPGAPIDFIGLQLGNPGTDLNPVISNVVRNDGLPDNCGDVAPAPVDPEPVPAPPTDITYDIDVNTEITVPLTAIFAPVFLSFDGSLKVPVTVNVGGLDFDGSVTISPQFEVNIKPTINIGGPGDVDDPDVIGEPGGGPTEVPDSEDLESTIVGVLVYSDITAEASPSGVAFSNGPDLYVPRLASVQFAIKTRDSIGWTSDQDVKNLECYVACPAPQGAIAVRVSPMPGVISRFTAVRALPLTSF